MSGSVMAPPPNKEKGGCPVKKGEKCPYEDKSVCPHHRAAHKEVILPLKEKKIYLMGTIHVSKESVKRVEDVIRTVLPNMVCLELDINRFKALQESLKTRDQNPETTSGEGGHFRYSTGGQGSPAIKAPSFKEIITIPGLLRWLQQQIGEEFGVMPGAEMASALETAQKYNISIGLIDRPVEATMARMWGGMDFKEKIKLFGSLGAASIMLLLKPLFGHHGQGIMSVLGDGKTVDMSKLERGEGIDELMVELEKQFPSIYRALVDERNAYMSNNILHILREKADVLVVVVGMGHVSGMKTLLEAQGVKVIV